MGGGWFVGAKIKDQQGLMKDRVRERYSERIYNNDHFGTMETLCMGLCEGIIYIYLYI